MRLTSLRFAILIALLAGAYALPQRALKPATGRTIWRGRSGEFTVECTTANLKAFRTADLAHPILDLAAVAQADWKKLSKDSGDSSLSAEYVYRLLSLVGPVLSIEEDTYCDCGGAHPTAGKQFRAIDLSRSHTSEPAAAQLTDLFPADAIRRSLSSDSMVKRALPAAAASESVNSLVRSLAFKNITVGECSFYFPQELLSRFAFFDVKGGRAAVRLSLSHAVETCRGQMTQIGLDLPVPEHLKGTLEAAKSGREGVLMSGRKGSGEEAVTKFEFSQNVK